MTEENKQSAAAREPAGLGVHNHGPAAEYAQEQGWGTEEDSRKQPTEAGKEATGGTDYEYGARDFGDNPKNEGGIEPSPEAVDFLIGNDKDLPKE